MLRITLLTNVFAIMMMMVK